jgi:hypothetical protein
MTSVVVKASLNMQVVNLPGFSENPSRTASSKSKKELRCRKSRPDLSAAKESLFVWSGLPAARVTVPGFVLSEAKSVGLKRKIILSAYDADRGTYHNVMFSLMKMPLPSPPPHPTHLFSHKGRRYI